MAFEIINWETEAQALLRGDPTSVDAKQIVRHLLPWAQAAWRQAAGMQGSLHKKKQRKPAKPRKKAQHQAGGQPGGKTRGDFVRFAEGLCR